MTRRRDLEQHRNSLGEIGEIMGSMRTLAYLETRKLSRFLAAEQTVVETIEQVAADFLSFHPDILRDAANATPVYLLFGSERGFCGDFNRSLLEKLSSEQLADQPTHPRLIAVGHKLHALLENDARNPTLLEGPSVAEDVPAVLQAVIDELDSLRTSIGSFNLNCVYHTSDGLQVERLLPPFERQRHLPPAHSNAPLLNVPAPTFLLDLIEHHLFAALNHELYTSLMVENHRRMTHLDRAVRHLDEKSHELSRRCNALRQEEIIEEIEVILLSAASLDRQPGAA
jgi:F-type H+-transporting ATPase subunit gamma